MRRLSEVLQSSRKWIFLFALTVLLPSLLLGLLAIRAFKGEEIRQRYQRKERQQQIVRLLETDLNSWLLSLQTDSKASKSLFKLQVGDDHIVLPDLNVIITGKKEDQGAFKTPTLREIPQTAPYMHDGSLPTLEEVIEFYNRGANPNPYLDPELRPLNLTTQEKRALVTFLRALSGAIQAGMAEKMLDDN